MFYSGITIQELVDEMKDKGYKITPSAVKYYIDKGLMPDYEKTGGYSRGVRIYFHDKDEALSRITKIFELKGRGYKLADIKQQLKEEHFKNLRVLSKNDLKNYKKINEHYLNIRVERAIGLFSEYNFNDFIEYLINSPRFKYGSEWKRFPKQKIILEKDFSLIEKYELFYPTNIYQDILLVSHGEWYNVAAWICLRHNYKIKWKTLRSLFNQNKKNIEKYIFFPEPDDLRFTKESIEVKKRNFLNVFGERLLVYFKDQETDFIRENFEILSDSVYSDIDEFIKDFLEGKCALVPEIYIDKDGGFFRRF